MTYGRPTCYYVVAGGTREREDPLDGARHVEGPAIYQDSLVDLAACVPGEEYNAANVIPPDFILRFYRRDGPMQRLIYRTRRMCDAVRVRLQYGHRSRQTVSLLKAVEALGYYYEHTSHLAGRMERDGYQTQIDTVFTEWIGDLRAVLRQEARNFADPFPSLEAQKHADVQTATDELHEALFGGAANELKNDVLQMFGDALEAGGERDARWAGAALVRLAQVIELAGRELEQGYRQEEMARAIDNALQENPDNASSLIGSLAGMLDNVNKGASFTANLGAMVAKNDIIRYVTDPSTCRTRATRMFQRLSQSWPEDIRSDVLNALESGHPTQVDHAEWLLRNSDDVDFDDAAMGRLLEGLGTVQALLVIGSQRPIDDTALNQMSDALSRAEAIGTVDSSVVKLIGWGAGRVNAGQLARCCRVVAGGLEHAGNFLSVASAAISIIQGFNTFSQGWAQNDEYMVRSGALQMASGVLVIIGVCCEIPVLQGAALMLGLMVIINDYERDRARQLSYSHGLFLGILEGLQARGSDHQRHCETLQVTDLIQRIRHMVTPDWRLQERGETRSAQTRWDWFGPHADQLRVSGQHGVHGWAMYLRNAGFSDDQIRQIFGGFASPHIR